jgi:hypothetical protein
MLSKIDYDRSLGLDIVEADPASVLKQLEFMFGGLEKTQYSKGRIEVGSTKGECRFFKLNQFDKVAAYVIERTRNGEKTYIHAGLIKPEGEKVQMAARGGHGSHSKGADVMCWPVLWGEADHANLEYDRTLTGDKRNVARLQAFLQAATWGFVYATGRIPSLRLQGLIRLEEPAAPDDPQFWSVLKSITANGHLDAGANNSSQLIRLAGSVSFAGGQQKAAEKDDAPRVTELVTVVKEKKVAVLLDALHEHHSTQGKLIEASPKGSLLAAKDIADLMSKVKKSEGVDDLDKDETIAFVQKLVAKVCELEGGGEINRRNGVLAAAKTIGGYLWTGHFEAEEIIGDDEELSLVEAYHANGGAADNGENNIAKGILDAMATGAASPLTEIGAKGTDGGAFGNVVSLDDYREYVLKPVSDERAQKLRSDQAELKAAHDAKVKARDVAKAVETEQPKPTDSEEAKAAKLSKKLERLHKLFDCLADIPDVENDSVAWGIKHVTALRTTSIMVGMWGAGKSAIAIDMGFAQSIGCPWAEKKSVHGVVVYVALENHGDIKRRLRALRRRAIKEGKDVSHCAFVVWHAPIGLFAQNGEPTGGERDLIDVAMLNAERFGLPVVQIIVDTVAKSRGAGNENDATDAGLYIKSLDRIANATGANVMALHHPSKSSESARGSGAYEADCDTVLNVSKVNGACTLKASDIKFRIGDPSKVRFSYRLHSEQTGIDEDGESITVVLASGVEPAEAKPKGAGLAQAADDDDEMPDTQPSDRSSDREKQVMDYVFTAEAERTKPADVSTARTLGALRLGISDITRAWNEWRTIHKLPKLGRSSVQDVVFGMRDKGVLVEGGKKGRPGYGLAKQSASRVGNPENEVPDE